MDLFERLGLVLGPKSLEVYSGAGLRVGRAAFSKVALQPFLAMNHQMKKIACWRLEAPMLH